MRPRIWSTPAGALLLALALCQPACNPDNDLVLADAALGDDAAKATKALLVERAEALHDSVVALCAAAPAPAEGGWVHPRDDAAIKAMIAAWHNARKAGAGLEGALALLPPGRAADIQGAYETALEAGPDPDPFDDRGFIGLHAMERVIWAERVPAPVLAYEASLDGYAAPAFPADAEQAEHFRDKLCARAAADTGAAEAEIEAMSLDPQAAYAIVDHLADGQLVKLEAAGAHRGSARYAGYALTDLRDGLATAAAVHAVFRPWLATKASGPQAFEEVTKAIARLEKQYTAVGTDALPPVPEGWSNSSFSEESLSTPFGRLFAVVHNETDSSLDGSLTHGWHACAGLLGIDGE